MFSEFGVRPARLHFDCLVPLTRGTSVLMLTLYHIVDLVDGKHAKKTKKGTPLGYFFNMRHGTWHVTPRDLTLIVVTVCWLF
jgi:hypothetical protein